MDGSSSQTAVEDFCNQSYPMCHHYRLLANSSELSDAVSAHISHSQMSLPFGDFYPLSQVPVVRLNPEGRREIVAMQWGLLPFWWKPSGRRKSRKALQRQCFNARGETIHEKPAFREAFKHRRCLIPATEFMERGHYFYLTKSEPFMFAGLWERWEDETEIVESCTIVTTIPNETIEAVGHHRMPVVLTTDVEYDTWLGPDALGNAELEWLFMPLDSSALNC